jgi:hypothetical protein
MPGANISLYRKFRGQPPLAHIDFQRDAGGKENLNAKILCCKSTPNWYGLPMVMRVKGFAGFQHTVGKME